MAFHWIAPPPGTLKINVHGIFSHTPLNNGNNTGIGAIYRTSEGKMKLLTVGIITDLSPLGNQMWAIFIALRRAFYEGYRNIILETDNFEAYQILRNFRLGAPAAVFDIASQIDIGVRDPRWICSIAYVFPARNKVARFLPRLRMEVADRLYTMDYPVGGVEELLDWDMGFGIDDPNYQDMFLPAELVRPVNFDVVANLSDQVNGMGLGQINAPQTINLDIALNTDIPQNGEAVQENFFSGGAMNQEAQNIATDNVMEDVD